MESSRFNTCAIPQPVSLVYGALSHSVVRILSQPAFEPRNGTTATGKLQSQMERGQCLVANEAAKPDDLDLTVASLTGNDREDSVETFPFPFHVDLAQDFGNEPFEREKNLRKAFRFLNAAQYGQRGKNRMKVRADSSFGSGNLSHRSAYRTDEARQSHTPARRRLRTKGTSVEPTVHYPTPGPPAQPPAGSAKRVSGRAVLAAI